MAPNGAADAGCGRVWEEPVVPWFNRWHSVAISVLIAAPSGIQYAFALYAEEMVEQLGWPDGAVADLGVMKDIGMAFGGIIGGMFCDSVGLRWTALGGASMAFVGFIASGLALKDYLPDDHPWMYLYQALAYTGITWLVTASAISILNFPYQKGMVSGLVLSYAGTGAAFYALAHESSFRNNVAGFQWFCGCYTLGTVLLVMPGLQILKPQDAPLSGTKGVLEDISSKTTFIQLIAVAFFLGVLLLIFAVLQSVYAYDLIDVFSHLMIVSVLAIVLNTMAPWLYERNCNDPYELREDPEDTTGLLGPTEAPSHIKWDVDSLFGSKAASAGENADKAEKTYGAADSAYQLSPLERDESDLPELGEEHTLSQSLSRKETWLLFFASVVGMGSATTLLNNLGEIVDAMGGEDDVGTYVSIQGVFMAAGRYGSGWMSEVLLQKYGINRVTSLMFGYFSIGLSAVYLAWAESLTQLGYGVAMMGFSYGMISVIFLPILNDLYGTKKVASLFMIIRGSHVVGSVFLADLGFSYFYKLQEDIQESDEDSNEQQYECNDSICIRYQFMIIAVVVVVIVVLLNFLRIRTHSMYEEIQQTWIIDKARYDALLWRLKLEHRKRKKEGKPNSDCFAQG